MIGLCLIGHFDGKLQFLHSVGSLLDRCQLSSLLEIDWMQLSKLGLNVIEHFLPLIRTRQYAQLLKRRQSSLFTYFLDNPAVLQSEDCGARKIHLLASIRPVQRTND
jgi:hypothetical protein